MRLDFPPGVHACHARRGKLPCNMLCFVWPRSGEADGRCSRIEMSPVGGLVASSASVLFEPRGAGWCQVR
jgi:hypothetical protein